MTDGVTVKIEGMDVLRERLLGLTDKLRKRAIRNALAKGARLVRDEARAQRRAGSAGSTNRISQYRRHGVVEKAINVRTSKEASRGGDVGVFVNVRPLRTGASAKNPNDPFYWRWLEFGLKRPTPNLPKPFLKPAASKMGEALDVIIDEMAKQINKLDANPTDPL